MDKTRIKEISQEIFESAYGYASDLAKWTTEDLTSCMASIQELATELQVEVGNSTTIEYIGINPEYERAGACHCSSPSIQNLNEGVECQS